MVRQPPARRLFFREYFTALVLRQLALANLARVVELLCRGRLMTSILPLNPSLQRMASRPHTDDIERQLPGVESGKPKDRNRCRAVIAASVKFHVSGRLLILTLGRPQGKGSLCIREEIQV